MADTSQKNSHSFFYVVMFMALVVLGTVITYFVFLPTSAPKQLYLAVLPFGGNEEIPRHLKIGLPADIRNELSLSRDVKVIDFQSSVDVFDVKRDFKGVTEELGASHFVDGTFSATQDNGSLDVQMRLVNMTQSAWKEVWTVEIRVQPNEWESFRTEMASTIREELYDLNTLRSFTVGEYPDDYQNYLKALTAFHDRNDTLALELLNQIPANARLVSSSQLLAQLNQRGDGYLYDSREMFEPTEAGPLLDELWSELRQHKNLEIFKDDLEGLVSDFPNSVALSTLADLYTHAGWYREAKELLFHWALLRPRSLNVGIRLANVDYLHGDIPGAYRSIDIAENRSANSAEAEHWKDLLALNTESNSILSHEFAHNMGCDYRLEQALYTGDLLTATDQLQCAQRKWLLPPVFWQKTDARWIQFIATPEYQRRMSDLGFSSSDLESTEPVDVAILFRPRRGGVVSTTDSSSDTRMSENRPPH